MPRSHDSLKAVGLFSGIGGFELGFASAGIETKLVCEIDKQASAVLRANLSEADYHNDICTLNALPEADALSAGFPCQNLSLVGSNAGIKGEQSRLINEVFRLIAPVNPRLRWVVLENVPFMLWHRKGEAIRYVTQCLEELGYRWAYRVIDTRAFGLPQRRRRVIIVASRSEDPCSVLFAEDAGPREFNDDGEVACGFSWTEGRLGLGWAVDCVPTLKAGSAVGVPSPPAIWLRGEKLIVTPHICDAERLQGFDANWTNVEVDGKLPKRGVRWRMVGNAIPVTLSQWVGQNIANPRSLPHQIAAQQWDGAVWPNAAFNSKGKVYRVAISEWPVRQQYVGLEEFLMHDTTPLSARASAGFLNRTRQSKLRFAPGFIQAVEMHVENMENSTKVAA